MAEPDPADVNPYAPLRPLGEAPVADQGELAEVEAFRRRYLSHEASVKSLGSLHYLSAAFCVFALVALVVEMMTGQNFRNNPAVIVGILLFYFTVLAFHAAMGFGLRGLKTWARWVEAVIVGLSLLLVLVVMVIGAIMTVTGIGPPMPAFASVIVVYGVMGLILGYVLYLLVGKKGAVVFSPEYRVVIDRTPHIKYRSSCLVWFLVALIVVFLVAMVGFWSFAPRRI